MGNIIFCLRISLIFAIQSCAFAINCWVLLLEIDRISKLVRGTLCFGWTCAGGAEEHRTVGADCGLPNEASRCFPSRFFMIARCLDAGATICGIQCKLKHVCVICQGVENEYKPRKLSDERAQLIDLSVCASFVMLGSTGGTVVRVSVSGVATGTFRDLEVIF